jgi:hypothetical protein
MPKSKADILDEITCALEENGYAHMANVGGIASILKELDDAKSALADMVDAFLARHGCFPLDRCTPEQCLYNEAMLKAYELVGSPYSELRATIIAAATRNAVQS